MKRLFTCGFCCLLMCDLGGHHRVADAQWWKGNTHTHTLWSDGDGAPELVIQWYIDNSYDFLVLSEHNRALEGRAWVPVGEDSRLTRERLDNLIWRFGWGGVDTRKIAGRLEMRLKTLDELRLGLSESPGILLIAGEEVSDSFRDSPVHLNAINMEGTVLPQGGESLLATVENNVSAIRNRPRAADQPVLIHLNHPNSGWAFSSSELSRLPEGVMFEIYNGHSASRNDGNADHPDLEQMWDEALAERATTHDSSLLYGVACDDAHHYHQFSADNQNPGRGWIMVRAKELSTRHLLQAMAAGQFYSTTGVLLTDLKVDARGIMAEIATEEGVEYLTQFIGTTMDDEGNRSQPGIVLASTSANPARYEFRGDELYVRCKITSSKLHPHPSALNQREVAWIQPVHVR